MKPLVVFTIAIAAVSAARAQTPSPASVTPTAAEPICRTYPIGESRPLVTAESTYQTRMSADGKLVAASTKKHAYLWNLATGRESSFAISGSPQYFRFTPDFKWMVISDNDDLAHVLDVATGKLHEVAGPTVPVDKKPGAPATDATTTTLGLGDFGYTPDGKSVVFSLDDGRALVRDLAHGTDRIVGPIRKDVGSGKITRDGRYLVGLIDGDRSLSILDVAHDRARVIKLPAGEDYELDSLSEDGKWAQISGDWPEPAEGDATPETTDGRVLLVELKTGHVIEFRVPFENDVKFVGGGKRILYQVDKGPPRHGGGHHGHGRSTYKGPEDDSFRGKQFATRELGHKLGEPVVFGGEGASDNRLTWDGNYFAYVVEQNDESQDLHVRDLRSSRELVVEQAKPHGIRFLADLRGAYVEVKEATYKLDFDHLRTAPAMVRLFGDIEAVSGDLRTVVVEFEASNPTTGLRVFTPEAICATQVPRLDPAGAASNPGVMAEGPRAALKPRELVRAGLCDGSYATRDVAREWDQLTLAKPQVAVGDEQLQASLLRMAKPGGFVASRDLPLLTAAIQSELPRRRPELIQGALTGVLASSVDLYEKVLEYFPRLSGLGLGALTVADLCLSEPEQARVLASAREYAVKFVKGTAYSANRAFYSRLAPLSPALNSLSQAEKDEILLEMATHMAERAANDDFKRVFPSKLYKFSKQSIMPLFGEKALSITDVTLVREGNLVTPVIFGTGPIDARPGVPSPPANAYGFYTKALAPADMAATRPTTDESGLVQLFDPNTIQWTHDGQVFTADLNAHVTSIAAIVPGGPGPKYEGLLQDGQLTGLIVAGQNMGALGPQVMDEYIAYYQSEGFRFDPAPRLVTDTKAYLLELVSSGRLDYLVKEAHSDGDEKNLFRANRRSRVLVGQATRGTRSETVLVLFADDEGKDADLISNLEFGQAVKHREAIGQGQLVYLNTSCWSARSKAEAEIQAAATPLLVDIPSVTMALTFSSRDPLSAIGRMLTGLRQGQTWSGIRELLSKNEGYRTRTNDWYVFPDEYEYETMVLGNLTLPLQQDVRIRDGQGRPYNLDQVE